MSATLSLLSRLLPATTAQASCTEYFTEIRCICLGCDRNGQKQSRTCRICNGVKTCSSWVNVSGYCRPCC